MSHGAQYLDRSRGLCHVRAFAGYLASETNSCRVLWSRGVSRFNELRSQDWLSVSWMQEWLRYQQYLRWDASHNRLRRQMWSWTTDLASVPSTEEPRSSLWLQCHLWHSEKLPCLRKILFGYRRLDWWGKGHLLYSHDSWLIVSSAETVQIVE